MSYSTWIGIDKKTDASIVSLRKKIVTNRFSISNHRNKVYDIFRGSELVGRLHYQYGYWLYNDHIKRKYYEVNSNGSLINGVNW